MIVVVNRVKANNRETLERLVEALRGRRRLVDERPGFLGIELLVDWEGLEALVVTRWESREAFEAWTKSREFAEAHKSRIEGLRSEGRVYELVPIS